MGLCGPLAAWPPCGVSRDPLFFWISLLLLLEVTFVCFKLYIAFRASANTPAPARAAAAALSLGQLGLFGLLSQLSWAHCLQPEPPHTAAPHFQGSLALPPSAVHSLASRCTASLARCMLKILGLGSGRSTILTSSWPDKTFS